MGAQALFTSFVHLGPRLAMLIMGLACGWLVAQSFSHTKWAEAVGGNTNAKA